jgi:hypothetical protein
VGARGRQVAVVGRKHRCEEASGGLATAALLHAHRHALVRTRGHGLSWAADKRALPLKLFSKFQNQHKFVIQIGDLPNVKNAQNFVGQQRKT